MSTAEFDAIVIGSGSGGLTAAIGLSRFGKRIALIERGPVGGDCTNTGCIPSKRLIHLARTASPGVDPAAVLEDVRATRDGLSARERRDLEDDPGITLITGHGTLGPARTVTVAASEGERILAAPHVVIATGSRARDIEISGLPAERHLTNETLFDVAAAPEHLAVVVEGAIGLEMATAFHRLGTRVTLIELADRVLPLAITEASDAMRDALDRLGIDIRLGARVTGYNEATRSLALTTTVGKESVGAVDAVLVAIGRVPNIEGLGLEAAGVAAGPDGIVIDSWGRTSARGVWAVGDVTPASHTTHEANAMGRRVIQRIALPWIPPVGRPPLIPSAVFSDPEVAWVGASRDDIARRCDPNVVTRIRVDLADTDRGLTDGVVQGFVSIDAVRLTGRIVAATVVGPNASEIIAAITLAMTRGTSLLRLSRMAYAYPTFAGALGAVADEFARATLPHLRHEAGAYLRYRWRRPARGGTK